MNFRKKIVVIFLLFSITMGGFYIQSPKPAIAAGFAGITTVDIPRVLAWVKTVIVRTLARKMITMLSNSLINKIRGSGRDGGPAFVRNWRNFITNAQYRGEDIFKVVLASTPVCNYLDKSIKDAFRIDGNQKIPLRGNNIRVGDLDPFNLRSACTLPSNFDMAAYRNDFAGNGGWEAWSRLMEPQNNYYGLLFEALDELKKQRDLEQTADLSEASPSGYTSVRDGCNDAPPVGAGETGPEIQYSNARCKFMGQVFTPADLLGKTAAATIDAEMGWLINSQQIADIVVGILNAVVDRVGNLAESALLDDSGGGSGPEDAKGSYAEEFCVARGPSTEAINYVKEKFPDAYAKFPPTLDKEKDGPIGGNFILASYCSTLQDNFNPYPAQNCTIECLRAVGAGAAPLGPTPTETGPPITGLTVCKGTKNDVESGKTSLYVQGMSCTVADGLPEGPNTCLTGYKVLTENIKNIVGDDLKAKQKICQIAFCAHTRQADGWWNDFYPERDNNDPVVDRTYPAATVGAFCKNDIGWWGFSDSKTLPKGDTICGSYEGATYADGITRAYNDSFVRDAKTGILTEGKTLETTRQTDNPANPLVQCSVTNTTQPKTN